MNKVQLEIDLNGLSGHRPLLRRRRRLSRARWWFNQMHAVVDRALDWKPASPGRPEQTYISLPSDRSPSSN
ncbi:MAG: hypothetical protein DME26_05080 [Verrucomicrobia bacterium]|nr:MAG: hypothetical protein DME26_05080 [Verrucomicrobiota bacterium]